MTTPKPARSKAKQAKVTETLAVELPQTPEPTRTRPPSARELALACQKAINAQADRIDDLTAEQAKVNHDLRRVEVEQSRLGERVTSLEVFQAGLPSAHTVASLADSDKVQSQRLAALESGQAELNKRTPAWFVPLSLGLVAIATLCSVGGLIHQLTEKPAPAKPAAVQRRAAG